jgi:sulfur carrier protein
MTAVSIELNGRPHDVNEDTTLAGLVEDVTGALRGSAVAVDGEVVPRGQWADYRLHAGQTVELISAVQGG